MRKNKIILGSSTLANYPDGGGHWIIFLQYLLGLLAIKQDVYLLEVIWSNEDKKYELKKIKTFFDRLRKYGLEDRAILLVMDKSSKIQSLNVSISYGKSIAETKEIIKNSDFLLNFCASIRQPLLGAFKHRVFIDLDPGHLQISALTWDMNVHDHDSFLTVGLNMHQSDCKVPDLGLKWKTFTPFVYLPMWKSDHRGIGKPFSSITHWNWGELSFDGQRLSISKRDAYLRYIDLPKLTGKTFELATYLPPNDSSGDRELLRDNGWKLIDPWRAVNTPQKYRHYLSRSQAEISCPKPIYRELRTGWISDRSVCYLASGRPVLAEDTGFSNHLPVNDGIIKFDNMKSAVDGVKEIERNYDYHSQKARQLSEDIFDSEKCLRKILNAC